MTDLQSLIADIDDALTAGSRLPWTKPEGVRERRILERVRRYLSQQQSLQLPPFKSNFDGEIEALRTELVQAIRSEVEALRRERESLIAEIRQMQQVKETAIPMESSLQSPSDQILSELDSTQRIVFEALQRNLHSYDQSLSQGLEKMHSLSHQGEAIFTAFIAHLTQHLAQVQLATTPPAPEVSPVSAEPDADRYPYAGMEVETASTEAMEELSSLSEEIVSLDGWDLEMAELVDEADIDTIIQYELEPEAEPPINQEQVEQLYENLFGAISIQVEDLEEQAGGLSPNVSEDASNVEEGLFGGISDPSTQLEEASEGQEDLGFEGEIGASAEFEADSGEIPADLLALLPPLEESLEEEVELEGRGQRAEGRGEEVELEAIASLSDLESPESDLPTSEEDYIPASPEENLLVSEESNPDVSVSLNPNTLQQLSADLSRYEDPSLASVETEQVPLPERLTEIEQNSFLTNSTVGANTEETGDYEWEYDPETLSEVSPIPIEESDRLVPGSTDYSALGFEPDLFPTDELLATPDDLSESAPFIEMAWDESIERLETDEMPMSESAPFIEMAWDESGSETVEDILIPADLPTMAVDESIASPDVDEILIPSQEEPLMGTDEFREDSLVPTQEKSLTDSLETPPTDSTVEDILIAETQEGRSTDMASSEVSSSEPNGGTTESSTLPDDYESR